MHAQSGLREHKEWNFQLLVDIEDWNQDFHNESRGLFYNYLSLIIEQLQFLPNTSAELIQIRRI